MTQEENDLIGLEAFFQFAEQLRTDRKQIATGEFEDFAATAETGPHDFGRVSELLVIAVNLLHGQYAGVFRGSEVFPGPGFGPVEDAANERGDQGGLGFSAGDGLWQ